MAIINAQAIAEELVEIYMNKDESMMTDAEKRIKQDFENSEYQNGSEKSDFVKLFKSRIENVQTTFTDKNTVHKICSSIIVPKPSLDLLNSVYEEDELLAFFKVYVEESSEKSDNGKTQKNRKAKYNIDYKIDVNKDYSFVMDVLKEINPDMCRYCSDLNDTEDSWEAKKQNEYRVRVLQFAVTIDKLWIQTGKTNFGIEHPVLQDIWDSFEYHESWLVRLLAMVAFIDSLNTRILKEEKRIDRLFTKEEKQIDRFFPKNDRIQKQYEVIWNLCMFVINKIFQNIYLHMFKEVENAMKEERIIKKLVEISSEFKQDISTKSQIKKQPFKKKFQGGNISEPDIIKDMEKYEWTGILSFDYYRYSYLLKIRSGLTDEIFCGKLLSENYIAPYKKDGFLEQTVTDSHYTKAQLCQKFHSGTKVCKLETFNKRLEFCKEFLEIYSKEAGRRLSSNNWKHLRAIYRSLYINPVYDKEMRMTTRTMATRLFQHLTQDKANQKDKNILRMHFILGRSLSRELMLEEPNGEKLWKFQEDFLAAFYPLMLEVLFRDSPPLDANEDDFMIATDRLRTVMLKIVKMIFKEVIS